MNILCGVVMKVSTLTPAYGRDYKSAKAVKADFDENKDFIVADMMHPYSGKPINKSQLAEIGQKTVMIRYKGLREIRSFKV